MLREHSRILDVPTELAKQAQCGYININHFFIRLEVCLRRRVNLLLLNVIHLYEA